MEVVGGSNTLLPGDPRLIDHIVCELKSKGIFDQFRKECIADVDTKPAYQNLRQRVEGSVAGFLRTKTWRPDMNKNQLREMLRKYIHESGFLETGVERIVDQVVNPKIKTVFVPQVEDVVYEFLGLEKPSRNTSNKLLNGPLTINTTDLLPTDLDPISPDTDVLDKTANNKCDANSSEIEVTNLDDSKIDEFESPPFELHTEHSAFEAQDESSNDSRISGISGLTSHDSNLSENGGGDEVYGVINSDGVNNKNTHPPPTFESNSCQDTQLSKVSSNSRLSIVTFDGKQSPEKMDISDDNSESKIEQNTNNNNNTLVDTLIKQEEFHEEVEEEIQTELNGSSVKKEQTEIKTEEISNTVVEEVPMEIDIEVKPENENIEMKDEIIESVDSVKQLENKNEETIKDDTKRSDGKSDRNRHSSSRHSESSSKDRKDNSKTDKDRKDKYKTNNNGSSSGGGGGGGCSSSSSTSSNSSTSNGNSSSKDRLKDKNRDIKSNNHNINNSTTSTNNSKDKEKDNKEKSNNSSSKDTSATRKDDKDSKNKSSKHSNSNSSNSSSYHRSSTKSESKISSSSSSTNSYSRSSKDKSISKSDELRRSNSKRSESNSKTSSSRSRDHSRSESSSKHNSKDKSSSSNSNRLSSSSKDDRDKKDSKKSNKRDKDDHGSSREKKSDHRRSTDRDSNDGSSSINNGSSSMSTKEKESSNGSSSSSSSSSNNKSNNTNNNNNSNSENSSSHSNFNETGQSDNGQIQTPTLNIQMVDLSVAEISLNPSTSSMITTDINESKTRNPILNSNENNIYNINRQHNQEITIDKAIQNERINQETTNLDSINNVNQIKLKKPKIASNIYEARKLMRIRKKMEKEEKKRQKKQQQQLIDIKLDSSNSSQEYDNDTDSMDSSLTDNTPTHTMDEIAVNIAAITGESLELDYEQHRQNNINNNNNNNSSIFTKENWDMLEQKLNENTSEPKTKRSKYSSEDEDCLYFSNKTSPTTERFLQSVEKFQQEHILTIENIEKMKHNNSISKKSNVNKGKKRKLNNQNNKIDSENNNLNDSMHAVVKLVDVIDSTRKIIVNGDIDDVSPKTKSKSKKTKKAANAVNHTSSPTVENGFDIPVKNSRASVMKNQRYSSDDLYKPRPVLSGLSRRQRGLLNSSTDPKN